MQKPKVVTEIYTTWQSRQPLPLLATVWMTWKFQGCQISQGRTGESKQDQPFHEPQNSTLRITVLKTPLQTSFLHNKMQRRRNRPVTYVPCFPCPEGYSYFLDPTCCLTEVAGQTDNTHWRGFLYPESQKSLRGTHYYFMNHPPPGLRDFHANSGIQ